MHLSPLHACIHICMIMKWLMVFMLLFCIGYGNITNRLFFQNYLTSMFAYSKAPWYAVLALNIIREGLINVWLHLWRGMQTLCYLCGFGHCGWMFYTKWKVYVLTNNLWSKPSIFESPIILCNIIKMHAVK